MFHSIGDRLTQWFGAHYGQAGDLEWQAFLDRYTFHAMAKIAEQREEHVNLIGDLRVFGVSGVGDCTAKALYRLNDIKGDRPDGRIQQVWFQGHMLEPFAYALLAGIGWEVQTQVPVERRPFSTKADGLIVSSPGYTLEGCLLSVKSAGFKGSWGKKQRGMAAIVADGILAEQPGYWAQAQIEMWASGRDGVLFLVIAKDYSGDWPTIVTEYVARDDAFIGYAVPIWQELYLQRHASPVPRVLVTPGLRYHEIIAGEQTKTWTDGYNRTVTGTFNPCFKCEFARICRGER